MGLFLIHQHFGDQLGTHLSHVEIVCYDGVHSAYLKVQCLCNHPNIHSMVRVQQITHTSHIFIDVAGWSSSRAGVAGHLFPILLESFQSPWNLQRQYRRIPVGLLDQLISISVTSAEFGTELDRIPLFDHLLHCASWHSLWDKFHKINYADANHHSEQTDLGYVVKPSILPSNPCGSNALRRTVVLQ